MLFFRVHAAAFFRRLCAAVRHINGILIVCAIHGANELGLKMKKLETKFLESESIRIAYTEYGTGENLILLHGNSENKHTFYKYQVEHFKDYHSFALDSRDHGESVGIHGELSIKQISDDVILFCKMMGIEKAKVIGYSDGGNIALFLAVNAPNIFEKLVAISPNYLVNGTVEKWLIIIRAFYRFFRVVGAKKQQKRFELMLNDIGLSIKEMNEIKTNMEILYASNDMIKEDHIIEIHKSIPKSKLIKITPSSHISIINKDQAIREMKEYLK